MLFSTLAAGLFYALYMLSLRRDRRLRLSRAYLIATMVFSLTFPLIRMPETLLPSSMSEVPVLSTLLSFGGDEIVVTSDAKASSPTAPLLAVYLLGMALTLAILLVQTVMQAMSVLKLRRKYSVYGAEDGFLIPQGTSLILTPDSTSPYSFFNQIVVGTQGLSDDELRCILSHESLHVRQKHTIDVLLTRLLCCVAWFNPFTWLGMHELFAVHEYQADTASLGECGREDYLHLLYRQATGIGYGHITNNFNSINIKKRIVMMNKTKTRFGAWTLLAALPIAALMMTVGCIREGSGSSDGVASEKVDTGIEATIEPVISNTKPDMSVLDEVPEFPGGTEALYKYISENIQYPEQAKEDGIEGRVLMRFTVAKDGSIVNVEVARGIGGGCDEEALRVVKAMPKWKPAIKDGKPVAGQYALPIHFKLQ